MAEALAGPDAAVRHREAGLPDPGAPSRFIEPAAAISRFLDILICNHAGPLRDHPPCMRRSCIVRIQCLMTASELSPAIGVADLEQLYRDLHANPELSLQEHRTAALAGDQLAATGFEVTTNIGGTGVVGVLANGTGPTALVRADMDALPVREETGLPYASQQRATDRDGYDVPVMHACGHDMHVTCLLGAVRELAAARSSWSGTLMAVFQPAEELGTGAQAMIDDGLFDRVGLPDVVLGQHVAPTPAGLIGIRPGPAFAAADGLRVTLYGRGAHGSRPEAGIDPVVMAAATVMRLQGVVSREVAGDDTAVVTVGAMRARAGTSAAPTRATSPASRPGPASRPRYGTCRPTTRRATPPCSSPPWPPASLPW